MAIKCNNCGGEMQYNVETGYLECEYCMEKILATEYGDVNSDAKKIEDEFANETQNTPQQIETSLYQCPECGAEVRCFENSETIFCQYCGKQTFLKQKENSLRPKNIIPFNKSQTELKKQYEKYMKGKFFVPNNIKSPDYMKEFRGVYIPCWNFKYETKGQFEYDGYRNYTSGNYDYHETYDVTAEVDGEIDNLTFDASEAFDDTIANAIAPFNIDKAQPFHEAYCAGFYMDKENVKEEIYHPLAEKAIADTVLKSVEDSEKGSRKITISKTKSEPEYIKKETNLTLLPVWFMTHRNKDRVFYSVANGQTGKLMMDLPVDKGKFFRGTALLSVILSVVFIFLFSTVFHNMDALMTSFYSLITVFLSSLLLGRELKIIHNKDNSVYDLGNKKNEGKIKKKTNKIQIGTSNILGKILLYIGIVFAVPILGFIFTLFGGLSNLGRPTLMTIAFAIGLTILQLFQLKKISKLQINNDKRSALISLVIMIIGCLLYMTFTPNDWLYYLLSGLSVVGIIANALSCIKAFNYLTSRPVPNFYEREVTHRETKYN